MSRLVLDAGAFIAFERGEVAVRARLAAARRLGISVVTTSPVVGQVWRDGRRQALLARLLAATQVWAPDEAAARRAGEILARTGAHDVVDALLVGLARDGDTVVSGDRDDITRLLAAAGVRAAVVAASA
jgi:predicted nucleic acid-binding protein